jgi:sortase (surface protein transpeptidase)
VSLTRSRPVRLDIPRIGVHTRLAELGLARDGSLALPPPSAAAPAGWYRYLASPGEDGAAVIVGHVDSARDGPAVFYRLGVLRAGDVVEVARADGVVARFAVTEVDTVPKEEFPSAAVYGPLRYPGLRLITCGGSFDRDSGHYRNNVIVFARLIGATTPAGVRRPTLRP